jgi:hypothetical protein
MYLGPHLGAPRINGNEYIHFAASKCRMGNNTTIGSIFHTHNLGRMA